MSEQEVIEVPADESKSLERNSWVLVGVRRDMCKGHTTYVKFRRIKDGPLK
jgi:hypothetical protein